MKLSKRERFIYERLAARPGEWSAEEISGLIFPKERPEHWPATVSKAMVLLCAKVAASKLSPSLKRRSPLGRGRKAIYLVEEGA